MKRGRSTAVKAARSGSTNRARTSANQTRSVGSAVHVPQSPVLAPRTHSEQTEGGVVRCDWYRNR